MVDGVRYAAESLVMESFPVQIRTLVRVTNTTSAPVDLVFPDGCVVGRYRLAAWIRPAGRPLELAAGTADLAS